MWRQWSWADVQLAHQSRRGMDGERTNPQRTRAWLLRRLMEVETLIAQWDAYAADQTLAPERRAGIPLPDVTLASCMRLRRRLLAQLAKAEAGADYRN